MSIALRQLSSGPRFTIYAMEEVAEAAAHGQAEPARNCPVETFLQQCGTTDTAQILARLDNTANNGPSRNQEQCRHLTGDIFEFKTRGGVRLLWFYDKGQLIICTSGYMKKRQKADRSEIERALQWKVKYDAAKAARKLSIDNNRPLQ